LYAFCIKKRVINISLGYCPHQCSRYTRIMVAMCESYLLLEAVAVEFCRPVLPLDSCLVLVSVTLDGNVSSAISMLYTTNSAVKVIHGIGLVKRHSNNFQGTWKRMEI
jgi:hypothetical protein